MISLYSGTPGSGKSLHIAKNIYDRLRANKLVIANFEINESKVKKKKQKRIPFKFIDNLEMKPSDLIDISEKYFIDKKGNRVRPKEGEILLVIDECQLLFNSREWQRKSRAGWLSFFSQHRKYGYNIVLIAQFDGMVDKQIRSLIEYEVKHRKVSNFGTFGLIFSIVGFGSMFVAVKIWYPLGEKIDSEWFRARKKYYSIYDTFGFFEKPEEKEGS